MMLSWYSVQNRKGKTFMRVFELAPVINFFLRFASLTPPPMGCSLMSKSFRKNKTKRFLTKKYVKLKHVQYLALKYEIILPTKIGAF